jgi:tetratricopeptide (TPR) repeat protein
MGAYGKAEPLFEQALQISRKALGPEHPDTARSLGKLAALYESMGAYDKAEPLYQQAIQILKKALGPEHPANQPIRSRLQSCNTSNDSARGEFD